MSGPGEVIYCPTSGQWKAAQCKTCDLKARLRAGVEVELRVEVETFLAEMDSEWKGEEKRKRLLPS